MTQEEESEDTPQLRSLPGEWWRLMTNEWQSRTSFGKLFYPLWLIESAYQWSIFIGIFVLVEFVSALIVVGDWFERKVPNTHKDE